jgi:hypothetical protein
MLITSPTAKVAMSAAMKYTVLLTIENCLQTKIEHVSFYNNPRLNHRCILYYYREYSIHRWFEQDDDR